MKTLGAQTKIALKNILFATDFEARADRALPFAATLATRYGAKLLAAHVIPQEAYAFARPDSAERTLREAQDHAGCKLDKMISPLQLSCQALLGEGSSTEGIIGFARTYAADLIVVGTSSRSGLGKLFLGSVAEEIIREAPCPVLTVGPRVVSEAPEAFQSILCATDFSATSWRVVDFAVFLAHEFRAHLTLTHVVSGMLRDSPRLAIEVPEQGLRALIPPEPQLDYEPQVVVEIGPVAEGILSVAKDMAADLIVMGAREVGAFAQTVSHFSSTTHEIISVATCPVLTVGGTDERDCD
jgi:nucleotide-binding universal stress UspA family protein